MNYDRDDQNNNLQELFDECKNLMDYHIILVMKDGTSFDGVIDKVDSNGVMMMVGEDILYDDDDDQGQYNTQRQFNRPRKMRRHRRFRRRGFPFNSIHRIFPIPYPYPFYPIGPFSPF